MASKDVLLILMHWAPKPEWVAELAKASPGVEIITHVNEMYSTELPKEITPDVWKRVTALFTWKTFPPLNLVPNLQYVQIGSAGCNQILGLPLFEDTDIAFCTANGVHPPQIVEWAFSNFLSFQHHALEHSENQKISKWVDPETDEDTEDAVGLRVGILGYGCVGRQCARVAKAFGMDVYAYTLHERATTEAKKDDSFSEPGLGDPEGEFPSKWFFGQDQLNAFLGSDLDLLIITLPLTDRTRGMISREQFALLGKKKAYVCNAGRGPIINTDDIITALNTEQIRGAALDVTDPEPLTADHPLWKAKNVVITPHCSGNSNHFNERTFKILTYNMGRRYKGQNVVNRVSKSLGY